MKNVLVGGILISSLVFFSLNNVSAQPAAGTPLQAADKISLDIKGMDILDVLRILSTKAGINIVTGKNVTGRVTLFLKDVDMWDAFDIIIAANDLAYEKRGNIIYVMTQRDYEINYGKKYEDKRVVKSIKLKYVKAADVAKSVSQLKTNIGRVIADEASETIIIMDIPSAIKDMEKVISGLDLPLATKIYSLKYASAEDVKDKLTEMLTKNLGSLRIDERTNKVAITDLEKNLQVFDKVIAEFDEKHKEVLIEAKILQISLNDDYSMGINWDGVFAKMQKTLHPLAAVGVNLKYPSQTDVIPTTSASAAGGGALRIGQLDSEGYQAVLQALREYGQTNILSSPRIVAINNEEAKILVGTNQPYATRSISQTSGGASNVEAENVTFLDLGVKLYVTPTINDDGYITMKIKPEVSSKVSDYEIVSSGNLIPVVKTTTTETTVMIKDGTSILIGGLIEDIQKDDTKEVPGLSRIPLLGGLFRSKTRGSGNSDAEKTELIIFLTPHIITGDEPGDMPTIKKVARDLDMKAALKKQRDAAEQKERKDELARELPDKFNITPEDYYNLISDMIIERVKSHRPVNPIHGKVVVYFVLDKNGNLISEPKLYRGTNKALADKGIMSVKEASPFPAFPGSMEKEREAFYISIRYE